MIFALVLVAAIIGDANGMSVPWIAYLFIGIFLVIEGLCEGVAASG